MKEKEDMLTCDDCGREVESHKEKDEQGNPVNVLDGGCCEGCGKILCKACVLKIGGKQLCKDCAGI